MQEIRLTRAVLRIVKAFVDDVGEPKHGYGLMRETGFSSAKVYQILARLTTAGWLDRLDDPNASPETGGPPRISYRLRADAVPHARRVIAEAQREFGPASRRRPVHGPANALGST
jgi:DNA-binding PadR family transcriptional regulator